MRKQNINYRNSKSNIENQTSNIEMQNTKRYMETRNHDCDNVGNTRTTWHVNPPCSAFHGPMSDCQIQQQQQHTNTHTANEWMENKFMTLKNTLHSQIKTRHRMHIFTFTPNILLVHHWTDSVSTFKPEHNFISKSSSASAFSSSNDSACSNNNNTNNNNMVVLNYYYYY